MWLQALGRALAVLGRRGRARSRANSLTVEAYRGYGTREEIFVIGRVFRQPGARWTSPRGTIAAGLLNLLRRALRWGLADVTLLATLGESSARVVSDRDGYFRVHLQLAPPLVSEALWHALTLAVVDPQGTQAHQVSADVYVPPPQARFVVISDIDDTVVVTGVANLAKMMWRLFFAPARSRLPYPGVGAFYRALHAGASTEKPACNPILYVSRGPWSLYEVLDEFFHLHDIPVGPILFLREWGLTLQRPFPPKAEDHKQGLMARMLALYADLPFILVGDSGQHDPEIYAQVVRDHPRRVAAVYIRNVSRDPRRAQAIETLAKEVVAAGSTLMLADDTAAMAAHAHANGFISSAGLGEVTREHTEARFTSEAASARGAAVVVVESEVEGKGRRRARGEEEGRQGSVPKTRRSPR